MANFPPFFCLDATEAIHLVSVTVRKFAFLILFTLIISLAAPGSLVPAASQAETAVIFTLDVCGSNGPFQSPGHEMPSLYECPCRLVPVAFSGFHRLSSPTSVLFLIPSPKEHPPQA